MGKHNGHSKHRERGAKRGGAKLVKVRVHQLHVEICTEREDGTHCVHWWDGDAPCCACGANS